MAFHWDTHTEPFGVNERTAYLAECDTGQLEDYLSQSFTRLVALYRVPIPTMDLMNELQVLLEIYKKLKRNYAQDEKEQRKRVRSSG